MDIYHFNIIDYMVFSSMLILSGLTGLYFGCRNKYCKNGRSQTLKEYMTGNGNLKPFPVSLSLMGSYISGVTFLGSPTEIYNFGTQYSLFSVAIWMGGLVIAYVYVPVFIKLQVNSSYEYLELRFNKGVRTIVSVLFVLDQVMFLPITIYIPSLAFNQVTGISVHLIGSVVCLVCIFYTFLGGLKAVVWTDSWQVISMFISVMVVIILGTIAIGGPSVVVDLSSKGGRLQFFNFSPNMYERYTVFSVVIGGFTFFSSFSSVNQTMVQRFLSLPNERQAKQSVLFYTIGVSVFVWMCCYAGILTYATYHNCDPLSIGRIKADDQILPLFAMEMARHLSGVPGFYIAGVFAAALSSLSVTLNSTAQVFLEDFVNGCMRLTLTERTAMLTVKTVVLVLGIMSMGFLYVVDHMGGVLPMALSLMAVAGSTTWGIFTLGMVVPWANSYGAVSGGIVGFITASLVAFGSQFVLAAKLVVPHKLPVFVNDSCFVKYGIDPNITIPMSSYPDESSIFPLFRLSFLWISPVGVCTVLLVGITVSIATGKTNLSVLDPDLISPVVQWVLPEEAQRYAGSAIRKVRNKELAESEKMVQDEEVLATSRNV